MNNRVSNISFTSVMPMRVFIDGKVSANEDNIRRATRALVNILKGPVELKPAETKIAQKFARADRDYDFLTACIGYKGASSNFFRNIIDGTRAYFFTGPQAAAMEKMGKRIGPAKSSGLDRLSTTDTFEAKALAHQYFAKAQTFIDAPRLRVREFITPKTLKYEGEPLSLDIYTKSSGNYGKKGFKLSVEDIKFEKDA